MLFVHLYVNLAGVSFSSFSLFLVPGVGCGL